MKNHTITIIVIAVCLTTLSVWLGVAKYNERLDEQIQGRIKPVCPPCPPCQITAKAIKGNAIDYSGRRFEAMTKIKLPAGIKEIQIGEVIFTREQLEAVR